ncbi:AAA family ATPase [Azospirillum sp. RWY-5-1]|uniref:AAA family ATPase n=1 Tax=Azospirillum oleiclasticum TaxID=2735135 RepID=A0ABX2THY5_9PROT|nr:adenylate/guanylate cyclase domain-containing protein [Azospirillum oleiclasticum]NYZ14951.1 AAA family ATPase [Azospirillum oleiclasticum]NYZ22713.1 AAA family ATPase [Azospirillum oleiclasticum]
MPPHADATSASRKTAAERKLVTVLFADIVASSALVSERDPEEADEILRSVIQVMTASVVRYQGMVAQELGDGIMAMFGAPAAQEDHALRACLAAQDMLRAARVADGGADGGAAACSIRVGIASGEVVTQTVENAARHDQRAVGESVHLAAKLQQRADPDSVLISADTAALAGAGLSSREVGSLRLAAAARPVAYHELVEARSERRSALDILSGAPSRFVGRHAELATLTHAWREAAAGSGRVVVLRGEAGIGKSRLAGEFLDRHALEPASIVQWPQAPIRRLGEPDGLEAAAATLLALAGRRHAEGAAERVAEAAARGAGALAGCAIRDLLGLPVSDGLWKGLDPAQRLTFGIEGVAGALRDMARLCPIILLVEDTHWASGVMARLLDHLASVVAGSRVLLLVTRRPGDGGWEAPAEARVVSMDALGTAQISEFLDHWLGRDRSLEPLKARVSRQSQGVPLYLEESLRALETGGAIEGAPGAYRVLDADRVVNLPPTIHGLIASRIDTLAEEPRRTLLHAAVIGATFDAGLLTAVAPVGEAQLPSLLARLEAAGFLERARVLPNLEYRFRHALMQEVACNTLTRRERRGLHERILRALRRRSDRDLPGRTELLAHHAYQAENWDLAYAYGRAAGRRAEARSRLVEATRLYENGLSAIEKLAETRRNLQRRVDLGIALPRIYLPRGISDADTHLSRAAGLARQLSDSVRHARAASMMASFRWAHGALDEAVHLCREGLRSLGGSGENEIRIQLLVRLCGSLAEMGAFDEALAIARTVESITDVENPATHGMTASPNVGAMSLRARICAEMGMRDEAIRSGATAVDRAVASGHAFTQIFAQVHLGWSLSILGHHDRCIPAFDAALTLSDAIRSRLWVPLVQSGLGHAHAVLGNLAQAVELTERGFETYRANKFHPRINAPQMELWRTETLMLAGRTSEARNCVASALSAARQTRQSAHEQRALRLAERLARESLPA